MLEGAQIRRTRRNGLLPGLPSSYYRGLWPERDSMVEKKKKIKTWRFVIKKIVSVVFLFWFDFSKLCFAFFPSLKFLPGSPKLSYLGGDQLHCIERKKNGNVSSLLWNTKTIVLDKTLYSTMFQNSKKLPWVSNKDRFSFRKEAKKQTNKRADNLVSTIGGSGCWEGGALGRCSAVFLASAV